MADQILKAMNGADDDGDGVPDRLLQLFNDSGFSLNSDNWKNRRRVIFWAVGSSWTLCLAIACIAVFKLLAKDDIPPNVLSLATQIFYAMMGFSTTLILGYCGLSQVDTNSYRKHSTELAKSVPPPAPPKPEYSGYGYGGGYGGSYGYDRPNPYYGATPAQEDSNADPTASSDIGGPTTRKSGVVM